MRLPFIHSKQRTGMSMTSSFIARKTFGVAVRGCVWGGGGGGW